VWPQRDKAINTGPPGSEAAEQQAAAEAQAQGQGQYQYYEEQPAPKGEREPPSSPAEAPHHGS